MEIARSNQRVRVPDRGFKVLSPKRQARDDFNEAPPGRYNLTSARETTVAPPVTHRHPRARETFHATGNPVLCRNDLCEHPGSGTRERTGRSQKRGPCE